MVDATAWEWPDLEAKMFLDSIDDTKKGSSIIVVEVSKIPVQSQSRQS
jgi:hypothetical protein